MTLVMAGTLAQTRGDAKEARARYFQSVAVWMDAGNWSVPVFPGGRLLEGVVMVHLAAVMAVRFRWRRGNAGLYLIHGGFMVLILGVGLSESLAVTRRVALREGETVDYAEDLALREAVVSDGKREMVIPEEKLARDGIGLPAGVTGRQWMEIAGRWWRVEIRPQRYEMPWRITLRSFALDCHAGTNIPSHIASRVSIQTKSGKTASREALIAMNRPFRYDGVAFYQTGVGVDGRSSVLHVVRNPAAALPYVACLMMLAGLAFPGISNRFAK